MTTWDDLMPYVLLVVFIWTGSKHVYLKFNNAKWMQTNVFQFLAGWIPLKSRQCFQNKNGFDTQRAPQLRWWPHLSLGPWKSGKGLPGKFAPDRTHIRNTSTRLRASSRGHLFMLTKNEIYLDSTAFFIANDCGVTMNIETEQMYYYSSYISCRREHKN